MKILFFLICIVYALCQNSQAPPTSAGGNATSANGTDTNATIVEKPVIASPDAKTAFVFPTSGIKTFTIGDVIPIVLGFTNKGERNFNITSIAAYLKYPQDWKYFLQNYTRFWYGEIVPPGESHSFVYSFYPDPMLEPRDFGLQVNVFYTDSAGENYTSVFYNGTFTLTESNEGLDAQTLFTYVGILGVAGLIGFGVYKAGRSATKKRFPKQRVEYGTQQQDVIDNEWLEGTAAARSTGPRSPKSKPKKS